MGVQCVLYNPKLGCMASSNRLNTFTDCFFIVILVAKGKGRPFKYKAMGNYNNFGEEFIHAKLF